MPSKRFIKPLKKAKYIQTDKYKCLQYNFVVRDTMEFNAFTGRHVKFEKGQIITNYHNKLAILRAGYYSKIIPVKVFSE